MSRRSDSTLMVAVRPLVVLKYVGQLLLVLAVPATVLWAASLVLGDVQTGLGIMVAVMLISLRFLVAPSDASADPVE
jgi:hypothetical protein